MLLSCITSYSYIVAIIIVDVCSSSKQSLVILLLYVVLLLSKRVCICEKTQYMCDVHIPAIAVVL